MVHPAKRSQSVVHGFSAGVEIAPLGCLGEALQDVFDEVPFRRAEFTFNDEVARDGDRIPQLLDRLREADDLGLETAANLENRLALNADVSGLRDIAALVEGVDEVRDDCAGRMAERRGGGVHRRGWPLVQNGGPAMTGPAAARLHPAHAFPFVALIAPHGAAAFQQRAARPVVGARKRVSLVHTAVILTEPALDSFKSHTVRRGARIAFIVEGRGVHGKPHVGENADHRRRRSAGELLRRQRAAIGRGDPGDLATIRRRTDPHAALPKHL